VKGKYRRVRTIVIVATLGTRGDEVWFLKELIENKGHSVIAVDVGIMGRPHMPGDFTREEVAEAGGRSLQQLVEAAQAGADRKQATDVMIAGARKIVTDLYSAGRLDGILSLGGSTAQQRKLFRESSLRAGWTCTSSLAQQGSILFHTNTRPGRAP
jgi:uncharacterized protein (UPF0261 family)